MCATSTAIDDTSPSQPSIGDNAVAVDKPAEEEDAIDTDEEEYDEQPPDTISDDGLSVETDEEEAEDEENEDDAKDLLERVQDRLAMQQLRNEVDELKATITRKNAEVETISGQLRRSMTTKSELIEAHVQIEQQLEKSMKDSENSLKQLQQANSSIVEAHYAAEKGLLNDIMQLTASCKAQEQKHRQEMMDKDRKHNNAILEKDFELAQLSEEIRKNKIALSEMAAKKTDGFAGYKASN